MIPRRNFIRLVAGGAMSPLAGRGAAPRSQDWGHYGGDPFGTRYSSLSQITAANVSGLKPAWVHHSASEKSRYRGSVECTPLVIDGIMYIVGSDLVVQALNAADGKLLWTFAPLSGSANRRGFGVTRGVTYGKAGANERIYAPIQNKIWCLDAKSGKPVQSFGEEGAIDLEKDADRDLIPGASIVSTTPGAIYQDLLIVTSRTGEGPRAAAPGHIRAYDVRTGKRRWIFHTIPHPGEFGYDTWPPEAWKATGGANCWGGLSIDGNRGLVFLGTGSPTFDFFGGDRTGANLFGNSILALKAGSGERVWHFQTVHHDLWDYDIPCAPMLLNITHNGRKTDVVAQVSKTGWVYLLDRESGKPLYPIEERKVPQSAMAGEQTYPTQPFPSAPPAFSRQGIAREDLTDISPAARAFAAGKTREYQFGPMFTPPGPRETMTFPGYHGGALWGGGSFDPQSEWLYVNHNEISWSTALEEAAADAGYRYGMSGYHLNTDEEGYPLTKPPWGRLSAIDLRNATIAWQVPHGEFKGLTARGIPRTGTYIRGGNIVTAGGVVFSAGTLDNVFRAYDARTGKVLWESYLGGGAFATPSTYMVDGRQFVAIPVSDDLNPEKATRPGPYKIGDFVAFALLR